MRSLVNQMQADDEHIEAARRKHKSQLDALQEKLKAESGKSLPPASSRQTRPLNPRGRRAGR